MLISKVDFSVMHEQTYSFFDNFAALLLLLVTPDLLEYFIIYIVILNDDFSRGCDLVKFAHVDHIWVRHLGIFS